MKKLPIILLHAALGSKEQLQTLKELLEKNHQVYSFSFEGHGGVPSERSFSMELFRSNVVAFMESNAIDRAHFFGYSMGGYVALQLAHENPESVAKIVTYGTKFEWTEDSARRETAKLNPTLIEQKVPAFADQLKQMHHPNDWKELLSKTADMMLSLGAGAAWQAKDFQKIEQPVLITRGAKDRMVTEEESISVADALQKGSFQSLEDFVHVMAKNDISLLANIIEQFIQE